MNACIRVVMYALLVMIPGASFAPVFAIEVSGEITSDTVWALRLSPYTIRGDITIVEGVTLTVEEGVEVRFANASSSSEGYSIIVEGTLTAVGSADGPIVFTSEDTGRYWQFIEFTETSVPWDEDAETGSILDHCVVEYGGNGSDGTYGQAAVVGSSSAVTIRNSIIRYSDSNGILCHGSIVEMTGNRIHDTKTGIKLLEPIAAQITNNYLIENDQGISVDSAAYGLDISGNTVVAASGESYGACLSLTLMFHDRLSSYYWEQIGGPEVEIDDPESIYPVFTAPEVSEIEQLVFQLTVTNMDGLVAVDTVTIETGWENQSPVADAGEDQAVTEGDLVLLDASDSFDADDGITKWTWEQTSGTNVGLVVSAGTMQAGFTAPNVDGPVDDVLIFQVTVTDSGGLSDIDTVIVNVADSYEYPAPIADAGATINETEGTPVTLAGELGNPGGDTVTVVSWFWTQTEGEPVALTDATSQNATLTVNNVEAAGLSYTFQLEITDDRMQKSTDTVIVNITDTAGDGIDDPPNEPPTAGGSAPATVQEKEPDVVLDGFTGSVDNDGTITSYVWEQISGPTVTLTSTGSTGEKKFTAPDVDNDETLVFRLIVTDDDNLRATDEVSVLVQWENEAPVAAAGADQEVREGIKVLLDGSGSTDDQGITSYQWAHDSGPAVTLFNADKAKCYFTAPDVDDDAIIVFKLTVSDGAILDEDIVIVSVIADDENPVSNAGDDRMVAYGAQVTLDGSASRDPEAVDPETGIESYLWVQTGGPDVTLYDATTEAPYFTAPAQGDEEFVSLTFQLTVKDEDNQEGVDSVVVNVTADAEGILPVAHAGPDQTVAEGTEVTLTAAGSNAPDSLPELTVTGNDFSLNDETESANALSVTEQEDSNTSLSVTGNAFEMAQGIFLVYLYGFITTDDALAMTGNAWGVSTADDIAALIYDGSDNDLLPLVTYDPFVAEVPDAGATVSYPPMAQVEDDMTVDPDEHVTLDGSGTYDPDSQLTYLWEQTGGKTVTLTDSNVAIATFNVPSITDEDEEYAVTLTFTLTVTDTSGFSDSKEIEVTINTEEDEDESIFNASGCFIGASLIHTTK